VVGEVEGAHEVVEGEHVPVPDLDLNTARGVRERYEGTR